MTQPADFPTARLVDPLGGTDALDAIFSDRGVVAAMIGVEIALAHAAADAGAIPLRAAQAIERAAALDAIDVGAIVAGARETGTPAIALVRAVTEQVRGADADSARYVHWGATSQDITDTALVLLLARARDAVAVDIARLDVALRRLSDEHASTVMLGRTLLQAAVPITFGLKVAQWHAATASSGARLLQAWRDVSVVQYGGAAGTRAAAAPHGAAIAERLASHLGLMNGTPWHTRRDRLGALVAALGLHVAALGKIARDIALLMQSEVAEVAERGGRSSTMPHKRNPAGCAVAQAAAIRLPGLVSACLTAMVQEHERGVGGGQSEWPLVVDAVKLAGAAAAAMAKVIEELSVDPARMRANLDATGGAILAERFVMRLAPSLGRGEAQRIVEEALERARKSGRRFVDEIGGMDAVTREIPAGELAEVVRPESYLGEAEALRRQLLQGTVMGKG